MSDKNPNKAAFMLDQVSLLDGQIVLYRRSDTKRPKWQGKFKLPRMGSKRYSSGLMSLDEAKHWAFDKYDDLRLRQRNDIPFNDVSMGHTVKKWLENLEYQVVLGNIGEKWLQNCRSVANKHFIRFFEDYKTLHEIRNEDIVKFVRWRTKEALPKPPSNNRLASELSMLRSVYRYAVENGYISEFRVPRIDGPKVERVARPGFTKEEWDVLVEKLREWADEDVGGPVFVPFYRQQLRDYILFMANIGVRIGEARDLKFEHVTYIDKETNRTFHPWDVDEYRDLKWNKFTTVAYVNGKTGARDAVGIPRTMLYVQRRWEQSDRDRKSWVFQNRNGNRLGIPHASWKSFLEYSGLEFDPKTGQRRTLYSLRHTYFTFRLMYGEVNPYLLAKNGGTSVRMLERHYGKVINREMAESLTHNILDDDYSGSP